MSGRPPPERDCGETQPQQLCQHRAYGAIYTRIGVQPTLQLVLDTSALRQDRPLTNPRRDATPRSV